MIMCTLSVLPTLVVVRLTPPVHKMFKPSLLFNNNIFYQYLFVCRSVKFQIFGIYESTHENVSIYRLESLFTATEKLDPHANSLPSFEECLFFALLADVNTLRVV